MDWPVNLPFPIYFKKYDEWRRKKYPEAAVASRAIDNLPIKGRFDYVLSKYKDDPGQCFSIIAGMLTENSVKTNEMKTFVMSKGLLDALEETEIRSIPFELLKIPFTYTYIDISSRPILRTLDNNKFVKEIRGFLFFDYEKIAYSPMVVSGHKMFIVHAVSYAPGDTDKGIMPAPFTFGAFGVGDKDGKMDFMMIRKHLHNTDFLLTRLAVNSLLYINSANRDVKEEWFEKELSERLKLKSGRARRDLRRSIESTGKVFRCGQYIYIPQISEVYNGPSTGRKVRFRHWVRGHWHHFWAGTDRLGTRNLILKWVEPFLRGPDVADIVQKTYVVDKLIKASNDTK